MNNKLFCTFSQKTEIEENIEYILNNNVVLYNKIFVLDMEGSEECLITYNLDHINLNPSYLLPNTILIHRKKEFNTLYTINALNMLIKQLNNGFLNKKYPIPWGKYVNSVLLYNNHELVINKSSINKIIEV